MGFTSVPPNVLPAVSSKSLSLFNSKFYQNYVCIALFTVDVATKKAFQKSGSNSKPRIGTCRAVKRFIDKETRSGILTAACT